jgi:2-oxo-4-hydroxy-4-carboxy-5-ureidoimidazoline decarboxylase
MSRPTVEELFSRSDDEVAAFLGGIYEHSPWVAQDLCKTDTSAIKTVTALANAMKAIVDGSSHDLKTKLLCAHPDLCQKVGTTTELTAASQEEQSRAGLQSLDDEELAIFTKYNTAYREKFGFPFILAVRNATKYTVLSALQGRVGNSAETEFVGALGQVHKIAWMRLLAGLDTSDSKGFLTCHVLDTANGCPGIVHISLEPLVICLW